MKHTTDEDWADISERITKFGVGTLLRIKAQIVKELKLRNKKALDSLRGD